MQKSFGPEPPSPRAFGPHFLLAAVVILMSVGVSACKPTPYVLIQNQTSEPALFWCWDGSEDYILWQVRVPARSTIQMLIPATRPAKDGRFYGEIEPSFGLSFRGEVSGKKISKPSALAPYYGPEWFDTHKVMRTARGDMARDWHYFFILTPDDIVAVLQPVSVLDVKGTTNSPKPPATSPGPA